MIGLFLNLFIFLICQKNQSEMWFWHNTMGIEMPLK